MKIYQLFVYVLIIISLSSCNSCNEKKSNGNQSSGINSIQGELPDQELEDNRIKLSVSHNNIQNQDENISFSFTFKDYGPIHCNYPFTLKLYQVNPSTNNSTSGTPPVSSCPYLCENTDIPNNLTPAQVNQVHNCFRDAISNGGYLVAIKTNINSNSFYITKDNLKTLLDYNNKTPSSFANNQCYVAQLECPEGINSNYVGFVYWGEIFKMDDADSQLGQQ